MHRKNWIILASKDRGNDYGVGTFINQLSKGLASKPYINVFVLHIGIPNEQLFSIKKQGKITIVKIPIEKNTSGIDSKKKQEKSARNIARVLSMYLPEAHSSVIHMNFIFQLFIGVELRKIYKGKLIFTQHVFTSENKMTRNYYDTEYNTYKQVDKIITVTRHGKMHLEEKGVDPDKIEAIFNGIDPSDLINKYQHTSIKEKYGLNSEETLILYSGRIDPIKGLDYLCKAMERIIDEFSDCRLVIAGDGDYEVLIKQARGFAANISFIGFIPFDDIVALYHIADIGVIPSLEEHCSYVALEMLHCGLPVVASNLGGLKEIFIHEKNALLVDTHPDDTNLYGIAPKIDQLQQHLNALIINENERLKLGKNAKARATENFTLELMTKNYLNAINNLNEKE